MTRKAFLLFIIFVLVVVFSSCGYVEITCKITKAEEAYMGIKIDIPTSELDENDVALIFASFEELAQYWKDNGLTTELENYKDNIVLVGYLTQRADSRQEAYEVLIAFMTSDISPFSEVESGYSSSYFSDKLYISAKLDFSSVIDMTFIETLPPTQHTRIVDALNNIAGKVIFDFPGYIIDNVGKIENYTITQELSLVKPVEISMATNSYNQNNITQYKALEKLISKQEDRMSTFVVILIATGLFILLLVVVLIISVKGIRFEKLKQIFRKVFTPNS